MVCNFAKVPFTTGLNPGSSEDAADGDRLQLLEPSFRDDFTIDDSRFVFAHF
ncbi:hypothetical protein CGMCC3_g16656 [Colletotrichum fructicola]|nr:uncharacterized protein CGMCC3_g16656 [Colletotrichum fructicola]KAE9567196.1 hypothetical protein CGMCC3_g16656 [Colletotrichum fructicola]